MPPAVPGHPPSSDEKGGEGTFPNLALSEGARRCSCTVQPGELNTARGDFFGEVKSQAGFEAA
jgi:hypothetical protein